MVFYMSLLGPLRESREYTATLVLMNLYKFITANYLGNIYDNR